MAEKKKETPAVETPAAATEERSSLFELDEPDDDERNINPLHAMAQAFGEKE